MPNPKQQIEQLRAALEEHYYNYYVLDNATISDYEFNIKLKELESLEAAHPELEGKLTSNAIRVLVPNDSLAILNLQLENAASADALNATMKSMC